MLMDPMGGIVMTSDGNAILREITVEHPAAKSMIEIARTQDEEVINHIFFVSWHSRLKEFGRNIPQDRFHSSTMFMHLISKLIVFIRFSGR